MKEDRELSGKVKRRTSPKTGTCRASDLTGACALFVVNYLLPARVVFFRSASCLRGGTNSSDTMCKYISIIFYSNSGMSPKMVPKMVKLVKYWAKLGIFGELVEFGKRGFP